MARTSAGDGPPCGAVLSCGLLPHPASRQTSDNRITAENSGPTFRIGILRRHNKNKLSTSLLTRNQLDIVHDPTLVEIAFHRAIKAEVGEPVPTRHRLHPVAFVTCRSRRCEVKIDRAIGILRQLLAR